VRAEPVNSKSVWSAEVFVFEIVNAPGETNSLGETNSPGGFVYIDVGRRILRTCCSAVQAGIVDETFPRRQQPAIAVVSVSTRGSPAGCIAPHTLANLFHELGHAFHHIMGSTAVPAT
jgi:Zn-dependent oligopeptidase